MKRTMGIVAMIVMVFLYGNAPAQEQKKNDDREPPNLRGNLTGKWQLTDIVANKPAGVWDFQTDGKFQSTGHYLATRDASFRTDENRSIVYIQVGEEVTEWKASMTNEGILFKEVTPENKANPSKFLLTKVKVD